MDVLRLRLKTVETRLLSYLSYDDYNVRKPEQYSPSYIHHHDLQANGVRLQDLKKTSCSSNIVVRAKQATLAIRQELTLLAGFLGDVDDVVCRWFDVGSLDDIFADTLKGVRGFWRNRLFDIDVSTACVWEIANGVFRSLYEDLKSVLAVHIERNTFAILVACYNNDDKVCDQRLLTADDNACKLLTLDYSF